MRESCSYFLESQNYENTNEHLLVRAHKIHEPLTYQALFSLIFKIVKIEERLELTFVDSLKFNGKDKEELLSLGYKQWQHVILEQVILHLPILMSHFTLPSQLLLRFCTPPLVLYTWGI